MPNPPREREGAAIVASQHDAGAVAQLRVALSDPVRARTIRLWIDEQPATDGEWSGEIQRSLADSMSVLRPDAAARDATQRWIDEQRTAVVLAQLRDTLVRVEVVILLVSQRFLAAEVIANGQVTDLLAQAADQGVRVLPVRLVPVSLEQTPLRGFAPITELERDMTGPLIPATREPNWARVVEAVQAVLESTSGDPAPARGASEQQSRHPLDLQGQIGSVLGLAWSPDGRWIAAASDDTRVYVWEATSGVRQLTYEGHQTEVNAVAWSPDSARLASAADEDPENVQVWAAATGARLLIYTGHAFARVHALAWAPDGQWIATVSSDHTVQVWAAASGVGRLTYRGHADEVNAVAWSPDGQWLASGGGSVYGDHPDLSVQVWAAHTGERQLTYTEHASVVHALAWSPDGTRIASASYDGTVHVWDAASGARQLTYSGHAAPVRAVGWSPDGRHIASAGDDGTVQVWVAATGAGVYVYREHTGRYRGATGGVWALAWAPDGTRIASGDERSVQIWVPELAQDDQEER